MVPAVRPTLKLMLSSALLQRSCLGGGAATWQSVEMPFLGSTGALGEHRFSDFTVAPESQPPSKAKQRQEEAEEVRYTPSWPEPGGPAALSCLEAMGPGLGDAQAGAYGFPQRRGGADGGPLEPSVPP